MSDFSHLYAIEDRLDHEKTRVKNSRSVKEREWREHNVRMIEKEIVGEIAFLASRGIIVPDTANMTDDELLAELGGK